jgi:hypothetical protein
MSGRNAVTGQRNTLATSTSLFISADSEGTKKPDGFPSGVTSSAGYSFDYPSGSPGLPTQTLYYSYDAISRTSDDFVIKISLLIVERFANSNCILCITMASVIGVRRPSKIICLDCFEARLNW